MTKSILRSTALTGLFIIPFIPFLVSGSFFFPFITTKAYIFRIIVEIIFASWFVLALAKPECRPRKSWTTYALLAFLVIIGLADLFGAAPVKSFWSNSERMEGYIALLHFGMLYFVMRGVFSKENWKQWWNASLAAAFLMAIYCLFQLLGVLAIHQSGTRVDGTLGNAAYLAVYMLFHIFIALLYLAREKNRSLQWMYGLLALFLTIILYYTATRGAILGLLGGLLVAAILGLRNKSNPLQRKLSVGYVAIFAILVLGFFAVRKTSFVTSSPVLERFATISPAELATEGRSFIWPMALKGVAEHPVLGWGQENFNYVFNAHYSPEMFGLEPWFDRAHNIFLDWAIAGGILGLIAYLSLYGVILYYVWRRGNAFSSTDRVILTGLLAAYFFHNLFVFDNLTSYILFIGLLAYVDSHADAPVVIPARRATEEDAYVIALPIVVVALGIAIYFVNVRPMIANTALIGALQDMQSGDPGSAIASFEKAYGEARLGRPEVVEQVASNAPALLASSALSAADKNAFFAFASQAVEVQAAELSTDARYELVAGTFFENTGQFDQALSYLEKARVLSPGKQLIYEEIAGAYINEGDYADGLTTLKTAYELDTKDADAEVAYLVGAIYAGDRQLESSLKADLETKAPNLLSDDRITSAYVSAGRIHDVAPILEKAIATNPTDPQGYVNLAAAYLKAKDQKDAIATLERLSAAAPQYKDTVDAYIAQIKAGTLQ